MTEGKVTSEVVIAAFDDFIKQTGDDKPRVIVIDNASMHTSRLFREAEDDWLAKKNVHIVRLPTCSPELNQIEILWKMVKYYWVSLSAYVDFDSLKEQVVRVFDDYGTN